MLVKDQKVKVKWHGKNVKHFKERGYEYTKLGDEFYIDPKDLPRKSHTKVNVKCDYCGLVYKRPYLNHLDTMEKTTFKKETCKNCRGVKADEEGRDRADFKEVEKEFKRKGFQLLSNKNDYKNTRTKLKFICTRHPHLGEQEVTWQSLSKNKYICKECIQDNKVVMDSKYRNSGIRKKELYDKVKQEFSDYGYDLLTEKYKNTTTMMKFICRKHKEYGVQKTKLQTVRNKKLGCFVCYVESISGEKSHLWKGGKMEEKILERSSYKFSNWRNGVFERDNYTCQACGDSAGGNLNAHHIENYSENEDKRYLLSNGITLCDKCHLPQYKNSFHYIFGTSNNNKDQLEKFLKYKRQESEFKPVKIQINRDARGRRRPSHSKFTDIQVLEIRKRLIRGDSIASLSRLLNVNAKSIRDIYRGKTYKDVYGGEPIKRKDE